VSSLNSPSSHYLSFVVTYFTAAGLLLLLLLLVVVVVVVCCCWLRTVWKPVWSVDVCCCGGGER
jgi:hypothetical protein